MGRSRSFSRELHLTAALHDDAWIARRLPVWAALAELFLDTELDAADHRRIGAAIDAAGFAAAEGRAILKDEVLPAFAHNLLQVAGEWAGWSDDHVREVMLGSLRDDGSLSLGARFKQWLLWRDLSSDWDRIAAYLRAGLSA